MTRDERLTRLATEHIMVKPDKDRMRTFHGIGDRPAKPGRDAVRMLRKGKYR